ncbi:MAG: nitroreductase family protein [Methanothrix sp.]|jgi:nitroreductase|uniref:NADH dehydrogenase/NAD(P)H nitroreductase, putative n=1 Tax=Methanothrix harundinacea TaxID=301375 RepID=A0A101FUE4_9EURY|nr:MAG: NAD(P)H-dependent dehydrogenase/reductase [Methanosaeta sp. SDB]KUK44614.1 MAG: NADH dehydrogenase/NAD(P)H nitroreductase, putative [Methanothrix harundinacea]MDD2637873.1 nitroreductase family protein [Methanothrix sp.]MDI9400004.1 nitroreductase family protein [Euryarchaeota archaeon]KUK95823.1 MAG: NADH dehydrogenase/NAD(P)H nitroreductase, putative [Methanothrix harundinacea]
MIEILRKRRSIRKYRDKDIEPEIVELLKEAALRSPTSRNFRPWRFVFVENRGKLEALSKAKPSGSSFLAGARLGVVVCADEDESDVWIEDCSIASIILQLVGESLGLGSCWIQIRLRMHDDSQTSEEHIRAVLGLPESIRVESMIAFGYPDEEKAPIPAKELEREKILPS